MSEERDLRALFIRTGRAIANLDQDYDLRSASPEFCIQLLIYPNLKLFCKLHQKIKSSDSEWILEFIHHKGLFSLMKCVEVLCSRRRSSEIFSSLIISKCVLCIKEVLNLKSGMERIINLAKDDSECLHILSKSIFNIFNSSIE